MEEKEPERESGKQLQRRDFLKIAGAGAAAAHFLVLNGLRGKAWAAHGDFCSTPYQPPDECYPPGTPPQTDSCEPHVGNYDHCGESPGGPWGTGTVPDMCDPAVGGIPDVCSADPTTDPDNCILSLGDVDECNPPDTLEAPDTGEEVCQFPEPPTEPDLCLISEPDECNTRPPTDLDHCGENLGQGPIEDKCNTAYFDEDKCGQIGVAGTISDTCDPVFNDPDLCDSQLTGKDACDPGGTVDDTCNQQNGDTDHCGENIGGTIAPDTCRPITGDLDRCGQTNANGNPIEDNCNPGSPQFDPDICNLEFQEPDFCTTAASDACEEGSPGGGNTDHCGQKLEDGFSVASDYCEPLQSNPDRCGYTNALGVPIPDDCDIGMDDPDMCDLAFDSPDICEPDMGTDDVCNQFLGDTDHCGEWVNGMQIPDTCGNPIEDPDRAPAVGDWDVY